MTRTFDISDVMSVVTGRLLSDRHMDGLYDILSFMSGESVFTHQIPRVGEEARASLLRQHPALEPAVGEGKHITPDNYSGWLGIWRERYGLTLPVEPMGEGEHKVIHPLSELVEMVGPERVVIAKP